MNKITNVVAFRRNRSVPLPPPFDPTTLPDNAVITTKELAGGCVFRYPLSKLGVSGAQIGDLHGF